ncbi:MAG: phosphatase PAP2 family protein [Oscillibacter sp.]|nr:phosphatase PAP2 family protein [Oscillibacter sp.]
MERALPAVDYRQLRLSRLSDPAFSHLKLLLYWPVFGLAFLYVERLSPVTVYAPVSCRLDSLIPFCEVFLIPYLFWFVYLAGMHVYTLLYDVEAFRRFMGFIIVSYTAAMAVYFLFPTCQNLRPETFSRDNLFTRFLFYFYQFDTNTNVCPSIHVIGSAAVCCTAFSVPRFQSRGWKWAFGTTAVLICASTVFLKQHSVVDVLAAVPVCLAAWYISFRKEAFRGRP